MIVTISGGARATVLLLILTALARGQMFDFEGNIDSWGRSGTAFDRQPVSSRQILSDTFATVKVGGDYWRTLKYPLGQHGEFLISTRAIAGDRPVGTLTSPTFSLPQTNLHFSFLIGGTSDIAHERLELQVRVSSEDANELGRKIDDWALRTVHTLPVGLSRQDQDFLIVVAATGRYEQLSQEAIELPAFLASPRQVRLKLIDDSDTGHLNVDYIRFTGSATDPWTTPVWGYADYHTHPTDYLAFGGLNGVYTIWGNPGGTYEDYAATPELVDKDLPFCSTGHGGGPFANPFLNAAQKLQFAVSPSLLIPHGKSGAANFRDWPSFAAGAHQQMHITEIHRNYEGGLRLLVGLATDNWGAEYLTSKIKDGHTQLVDEQVTVEAQIKRMIQLADDNRCWMQVAHSPEEARNIILQGKLALILGVEVDQLGTYHFATPQKEIEWLWQLGVRVVTPIHAADNKVGGAAAFIGPYNWLNDLLHRGRYDLSKSELQMFPPVFFQIEEDRCPASRDKVGECVELRLDWTSQSRVYLGRCLASLFRRSPCLDTKQYPPYNTAYGQKNRLGLTEFGKIYIEALMDRGMILDTAHMSDASVKDTFNLIGRRLEHEHPACRGFSYDTDASENCNRLAYPAIISHAHFRKQALYGDDNFPPSEYDISQRNLELVRRIGGVVGPFVSEDRIPLPSADENVPKFPHDCANSSKSFGYSFHFALQQMGGEGVGMATDYTFIPSVSPRFGKDACWAYHLARDPKLELQTHQKDRYAINDQRDGVFYDVMPVRPEVSAGGNVPLKYSTLGALKKFDFNIEGLAHFGLVPDMLQDLKNVGLAQSDFQAMFSSVEAYLRMWEKTRKVSGHPETRLQPDAVSETCVIR